MMADASESSHTGLRPHGFCVEMSTADGDRAPPINSAPDFSSIADVPTAVLNVQSYQGQYEWVIDVVILYIHNISTSHLWVCYKLTSGNYEYYEAGAPTHQGNRTHLHGYMYISYRKHHRRKETKTPPSDPQA